MTYHNREADADRLQARAGKSAGKRKASVDASSQFKDHRRFRQNTLPGGGAGSCSSTGGISIRGLQDSREARAGSRRAAGA